MQHYKDLLEMDMAFMECDVLAGEQGPSCYSFDQVPNPDKVIHVCFIKASANSAQLSAKEIDKTKNPKKKLKLMQRTSSTETAAACSSEALLIVLENTDKRKVYPKSLCVLDMLKLGKVIEGGYESIELSCFDLNEMK